MADDNEVAVLVGNGLSIAHNPQLVLRELTSELVKRLQADDESDSADLMEALAASTLEEGVTSDDDFERLVGALDLESNSLLHVRKFAELRKGVDSDLANAINMVKNLLEDTRDVGVSHVLQAVTEYTEGSGSNFSHVRSLIRSIVDEFSLVNFSNLNYDTLLLAALMAEKKENELKFADLFDGREEVSISLANGECPAHPLRSDDDDYFEGTDVRLSHLHGSTTYWRADDTVCAKLTREVIKDPATWRSLRLHEHEYRPCVVLTNSRLKRAAIEQQPFNLAYTKFEEAVRRSSRWLVIGYSFRDEPVNDVLRSELHRRRKDDDLPQVLVVSHGDKPTRPSVELALGWTETEAHSECNRFASSSDAWLKIDRDGAFGLQNREVWAEFVDSDPEWPESSEW